MCGRGKRWRYEAVQIAKAYTAYSRSVAKLLGKTSLPLPVVRNKRCIDSGPISSSFFEDWASAHAPA